MELLNGTGKAVVALLVLMFCIGTIIFLLAYGNSANGLHVTALSWSYLLIGALLAGLGIGAALPSVLAAWRPPTS